MFHNTLVVGSSPTSSTTQSPATGVETRVRTRLVQELGIEMATITVAAVDGEVVIGGLTSTGSLPARVERVARAVEGVKSVNNCIKSVPAIGQFGIS